ncbi:unnamed protein product [Dimorphilus gyrociliatus]|nr:unnamed protein product [Dimorphilus gyrociliatus]
MGIDKMILLGHSLGGFLTTSYAIRYPERVEHLIVVDGWGFAVMPQNGSERTPVPRWIKILASMLSPFNPFAGIRALGFVGKHLIRKFRPDLIQTFSSVTEDEPTVVADYIYYSNSRKPSGESAFKAMTMSFGWAKNPMLSRIHKLSEKVPMTMIYGSRSWISDSSGWEAKRRRQEENENCFVDVHIIKNAGHHVYANQSEEFNNLINKICSAGGEPKKIRTKASKLSLTIQDTVSNNEHIHRNAYEGEAQTVKLNTDLSEIKQAARLEDYETIRFQVGEVDA